MNIQIYSGKKNFDTQKAERYFKERRIPVQMLDLKKHPLGEREIRLMIRQCLLPKNHRQPRRLLHLRRFPMILLKRILHRRLHLRPLRIQRIHLFQTQLQQPHLKLRPPLFPLLIREILLQKSHPFNGRLKSRMQS